MTVGERILVAARVKGVTQAELAEKLGLTQTAVSSWKKEGRNPPSKHIPEIARVLGVSVEYLMTGDENPPLELPRRHETVAERIERRELAEAERLAGGPPADINLRVYDLEQRMERLAAEGGVPDAMSAVRLLSETVKSQQETIAEMSRRLARK